jgi:hypothetical protein
MSTDVLSEVCLIEVMIEVMIEARFWRWPMRGGRLGARLLALRFATGTLWCSGLEGRQITRPRTQPSALVQPNSELKQHLPDAAARRNLPAPALLGCAHGPLTGHPASAATAEHLDGMHFPVHRVEHPLCLATSALLADAAGRYRTVWPSRAIWPNSAVRQGLRACRSCRQGRVPVGGRRSGLMAISCATNLTDVFCRYAKRGSHEALVPPPAL